jgi:predicted rRNA methylase YqxC with S4 and FtsJ domains
VDVGQGQLAWKLRQDARVVVMEKTNARDLASDAFPPPYHPVDLVVIDCSFISLQRILPLVGNIDLSSLLLLVICQIALLVPIAMLESVAARLL